MPLGQDHQVAQSRGQAGQGVGFEEVGDAVADPEVDPGEVAAAEGTIGVQRRSVEPVATSGSASGAGVS